MANIINKTIVSEGTQKMVVQYYFESDGNEGELKNYVILDPADCNAPWNPQVDTTVNPPSSRVKQFTILRAWSSSSWFDMTIVGDGATPLPIFVFARDCDFYLDFRDFGGLKDRVTDVPTGKILVSTKDFAPLGSNAFLVLELKKN